MRRYAQEQKRQETERIKREKKKAFRKKHWKGILIAVLLIVAALFGGYKYWEYSKLIPVGVAVESLIGKDYKSATEILKRSGFTNIHTSPLYDLEYENRNDDGLTVQISIADNESFNAEDKYVIHTGTADLGPSRSLFHRAVFLLYHRPFDSEAI